jgi:hypothetical protein
MIAKVMPPAPVPSVTAAASADQKANFAASIIEAQMLRDLWQAALADTSAMPTPRVEDMPIENTGGLANLPLDLLTILNQDLSPGEKRPAATAELDAGELKGNERYRADIVAASERTGIPTATLAAIIGAEARSKDGVWDPQSRNPRSTAAGLTQFLASTWEAESERPGTYLNERARAAGWLSAEGHVRADARNELLQLRFDPRAAIMAGADYAKTNLDRLRARGLVDADVSVGELAKLAYLAHHLGPADAERFLKGAISEGRSKSLLASQIGQDAASRKIEDAGGGIAAHRAWLINYVDRKIDVSRYGASSQAGRSLGAMTRTLA